MKKTKEPSFDRFLECSVRHCEAEIHRLREKFKADLQSIQNPKMRALLRGGYTNANCWEAYASDDFMCMVLGLSKMTGQIIGAPQEPILLLQNSVLMLTNPIFEDSEPKRGKRK